MNALRSAGPGWPAARTQPALLGVADREVLAAFVPVTAWPLPSQRALFAGLPDQPVFGPVAVEPWLEDVETEAQWRAWQLARQTAARQAREAERDTLNRALYRLLLGTQPVAAKN